MEGELDYCLSEQGGHSLNHRHRVLVILSSRSSQMVGGCSIIRCFVSPGIVVEDRDCGL